MNEPLISVVVPFRNRDLARVSRLHSSLIATTKTPFELIISDFGSSEPCASELQKLSHRLGFRVVRSETEGLPWNRAHAINNGVRSAASEWIVVLDVDMVLYDALLDGRYEQRSDLDVWMQESIWPQSAKAPPLRGLRHRSMGVFQFIHRSWFERLSGFCEDFEFWGQEDSDWVRRLVLSGAHIRWSTAEEYRLVHIWHPWENNPAQRPQTALVSGWKIETRNQIQTYENGDWGRVITKPERPILGRLAEEAPTVFDCRASAPGGWIAEGWRHLEAGELVRFDLGPRIVPRKLSRWARIPLGFKNLFEKFSLSLEPVVNANLEQVLLLRDQIGRGACDVFLAQDMTSISLVLRTEASL